MIGKKREESTVEIRRGGGSGFTLIELLVVISIIALLVSILLPSLNRARQAAQSAVCLAHLRQAGLGLQNYTTENNGWLPGPNTSGYELTISNERPEESSPTDPTQNMDWVSPILGDEMNLPSNVEERERRIFKTDLRCPANKEYYDEIYTGDSGNIDIDEPLHYTSYSAAIAFHLYNDTLDLRTEGYPLISDEYSNGVKVPKSYSPKIKNVGTTAEKVFAMDGARFINATNNNLTYNTLARQKAGGNFMLYGPIMDTGGDPFKFEWEYAGGLNVTGLTDKARKYAYRHNDKINVVYFDNHCENLSLEESLKTRLYFPRRSEIIDAGLTYDPEDRTGSRVP